jgi:hypothetical protein
MPSTIQPSAPFTPLSTLNFDHNLDKTITNLQALAEAVDELTFKYKVPIITHFLSATVPASTVYNWPPGTVTLGAASTNTPFPSAGTIKNLRLRTGTAQPATGSLVITIYVATAPTSVVITVAAGEAAGTKSDLVHTASLAAGDLVRVQFVNNATSASATLNGLSFEIEFDVFPPS